MKLQYLSLAGVAFAQEFNANAMKTLQKILTQGVAELAYNPLQDYGCWCYFAEKTGQGKGPAIDEYDAACKKMARGYECAMLDEPACVPWEATYAPDWLNQPFAVYGAASNPATIPQTCESQNTDFCQKTACIIEGTFIASVYNLDIDPNVQVNLAYKQANGFDKDDQANCPLNTNNRGNAVDACCGEYPDRRPFRFKLNERECCAKANKYTIYNSGLFDCCPDGSIQAAC